MRRPRGGADQPECVCVCAQRRFAKHSQQPSAMSSAAANTSSAPPSPATAATGAATAPTAAAASAAPQAAVGVTSSSSPPMRRPITIHTGSLVQLASRPHETLTPFQSVSPALRTERRSPSTHTQQRIPHTPQSSRAAVPKFHSASHPTTPNYSAGERQHSEPGEVRAETRPPLTAGRSDSRARNSFTHVSAAPTNTNSPSTTGVDTSRIPSSQVPTTNRVPSLEALTVPPAVRPGGGSSHRGRSDSNGSTGFKDSPPVSSSSPAPAAAAAQEADRRTRLRQAMVQQQQQFPAGVPHISMAGFSDMSFGTENGSFDANGVTRSPNGQHAAIEFDVRAGGATRAEGARMQMQMTVHDDPADLALNPPPPLTRQLSTTSVGTRDEERAALHPYTLFFRDELAETEFRHSVLVVGGLSRVGLASPTSGAGDWKSNSTSFPLILGAVAMMLFSAIAPYVDQTDLEEADSATVMRKKLIIASAGGALFILVALLNRIKHRYAEWVSSTDSASRRAAALRLQSAGMSQSVNSTGHDAAQSLPRSGRDVLIALLSPQIVLCVLFCAAGCLWAALNIDNDLLPTRSWSSTVSGPVVLLMILGFLLLDIFLFAHLLVCSAVIGVVFCVIALMDRNPGEELLYCIARCVIVVLALLVLCAHAYITELSVRLSHMRQKQLTHSKQALQKETAELRNEVFSLVLQKYDIIDHESKTPAAAASAVDLATPLEKSMKLLQELERDRHLSKKHFDKIRTIIEQLGSSQDNIFRPRLSQIVGSQQHQGQQHFRNQRQTAQQQQQQLAAPASFSGVNGGYNEQKQLDSSALQPHSGAPPLPHSASGSQYQPGRAVHTQLDADTTKWLAGLIDDFEEDESPKSPPGAAAAAAGGSEAPERSRQSTPTVTSLVSPLVLTSSLSSEEEQTIHLLTDQLTHWDFDVFEVCKLTGNRPLFFLGLVLFRKNDLLRTFSIPKGPLCNFLTALEAGYVNDLPYHNSTHAADVTRSMHFFLHRGGLKADLSDLEVLAALLAALSHDHAHPGVNNNFLVKTADPLAMLYNDKSVLEHMHLSATFKILLSPANNFLVNLKPSQFDALRRIVIDMVLATDLGVHFEFIGHFKNALPRLLSSAADRSAEAGKLMLLKMCLKCSDIAHAAKVLELHLQWSARINEEFMRQGDAEKARGLTVSPFMDRAQPNVSKAQQGFIDFLAMPMFELWLEFLNLPDDKIPCMMQLKANREYWQQQA